MSPPGRGLNREAYRPGRTVLRGSLGSLLKLGDLYTRQGATADASATYQQVAEQYAEQGFFLKAVAVYKTILSIDPTTIDAHLRLAELYVQLGLTPDATPCGVIGNCVAASMNCIWQTPIA